MSKANTLDMRRQWSVALEARGIEAVATLRKDRPETLERVAKGMENIRERVAWSEAKMRTAPNDGMNLAQRKSIAGQVERMKAEVKAVTLPFTQARKEAMGPLRDLADAVREKGKEQVQEAAAASVAAIGRDIGTIKRTLDDLAKGRPPPERLVRKQMSISMLQQRRAVQALMERVALDIKLAREEVQKAALPRADRTAVLRQLRMQERTVTRHMGRGLGR